MIARAWRGDFREVLIRVLILTLTLTGLLLIRSAARGADPVPVGGAVRSTEPRVRVPGIAAAAAVVWTAEVESQGGRRIAEVRGLAPEVLRDVAGQVNAGSSWQRFFAVYAEVDDGPGLTLDPSLPPMAGSYSVESGALRFVPAFPPSPGMRYRAVVRREAFPSGDLPTAMTFTAIHREPARSENPSTTVTRIAPSSRVVPENLLKFYLHFSAPMSRGHIYDHIHLRNAKGDDVELPFLEIDEELWNPEMTRLTLFLDPGRIKRGVKPLEEIGPSLAEGNRYTLAIDPDWRDAAGQKLRAGLEKVFEVGPPDREPPDPTRWTIHPPRAGSREALTVSFPEPMDDALTRRVVRVGAKTAAVPEGHAELAAEERQWLFVPESPWEAGDYELLVGGTLEDLAGNNPGKPFEVDLFEGVQRRITNEFVRLTFEVR
ncbi:MAG: hypothetical protein AB7O66_20645 [Limisphaerales bacterium]